MILTSILLLNGSLALLSLLSLRALWHSARRDLESGRVLRTLGR